MENQRVGTISIRIISSLGTLGILVEWVGDAIGFRNAMYLFFPGLIALDAVLFFVTSLPLYFQSKSQKQ